MKRLIATMLGCFMVATAGLADAKQEFEKDVFFLQDAFLKDDTNNTLRARIQDTSNAVLRAGGDVGSGLSGTFDGGVQHGTNLTHWTFSALLGVAMQWDITAQTTATLTLTTNHCVIVCDTTSNVIGITLPDASTMLGQAFVVFLETDGGNNVTLTAAAGDTLEGTNDVGTLADAEDYIFFIAVSANRWLVLSSAGMAYS